MLGIAWMAVDHRRVAYGTGRHTTPPPPPTAARR
jgi:hypothetical protein